MKMKRSGIRGRESGVGNRTSKPWAPICDGGLRRVFFLVALMIAISLCSVASAVEGDVVFKRTEGGSVPPAVFPHWVHRIRYKCYACHPEPFQMKAGANKITMELIQQGKFCGACHDGKIAWGMSFDTCNKCHAGK